MNVENLIDKIDEFSNFSLKRKNDLGLLIVFSEDKEGEKKLEDLTFTAKYVLGLQRILKKGGINPEITNLDKIKKDYSDNLIKVSEMIKEIMKSASEEKKIHINKTYLELNHQSLINLNELMEDLEWAKMYFNNRKRQ